MISILQPDQQIPDNPAELNAFELRRCPFHPNYNVEVYCSKENWEPSVMCIKCYLDPEVSKRIRGEPLIAIRDLILKSIQIDSTHGALFLDSKAEILEQKYIELAARDHVGVFKRHADIQLRKLDVEIDRLKQSLDDLRGKFIQFFEKQVKILENKQDDIERKVYNFLLEKEEMEKKSFGTLEELVRELNALEEFKDYEKFVRLLYKKSQFDEEGKEGTTLKKIFDSIDDNGTLLTNMKSMKIDTGILEEMKAKLDSIEVVDRSTTIPGVSALDPQLERTLDKLRKAATPSKQTPSKLTPSKQAEVREESIKPSPYKEKESPSFSKLLEVLREKKSPTPSPYKTKTTPAQKSRMDLEISQDKSSQRPKLAEILKEKNGVSPYKGGQEQKSSRDIESESKRGFFGGEEQRATSGEKTTFVRGKSLLENLREKYDPEGAQKAAAETVKAPLQKQKTIEKVKTSTPYNPEVIDVEHEENKQTHEISFGWHQTEQLNQANLATMPIVDDHHFDSRKSHESVEKDPEISMRDLAGTLQLGSTLDFHPEQTKRDSKKLETPPVEIEEETSEIGDPEKKKEGGAAQKGAGGEIVIESESSDQNKSSKHGSRSPSIQESSRENIVQQWIDQKLNGFVVFQNTLRGQELEEIEDFNKYSSQNWVQLSKSEKDEYTTLARTRREQLKEEFRNLCQDIEDISELQVRLDQQIKKVKK